VKSHGEIVVEILARAIPVRAGGNISGPLHLGDISLVPDGLIPIRNREKMYVKPQHKERGQPRGLKGCPLHSEMVA
jgi:hypothetical protein